MKVLLSRFGAVAAAAALAACAPLYDPNAGTPGGNANRNVGAVAGGALGGLLAGPITGGGAGRTVAGAAVGAVAGGAIGTALDRQAAELDRSLGDSVAVENQGDQLLVNFPQDILFATDSAAVGETARSDLQALAQNLTRYPDTQVEIVGHTDNTGSAAHNVDLSSRRAGAVSAALMEGGVASGRITPVGRGEDAPVASNLTEEGRAQNRRVEVIIRPSV